MAQKLAGTQGTSRRGLNTRSMDYQVTYQHSLRSAPEDFIVHVPSQMVCNVPATVDQIIQGLCPSGVLPQSAFGGNRRCRRCAWLHGDAIFSTLRVRSGRRPAGSLNATQLIRLISIETTGKRRNERRAAVLTAASELRGVDSPSYLPLHFRVVVQFGYAGLLRSSFRRARANAQDSSLSPNTTKKMGSRNPYVCCNHAFRILRNAFTTIPASVRASSVERRVRIRCLSTQPIATAQLSGARLLPVS